MGKISQAIRTVTEPLFSDCPSSASLRFRVRRGWLLLAAGWLVILAGLEARAAVTLTLPNSVLEGSSVVTNAGNFRLGVTAASNVVVTLTSSDPTLISVPETATVSAGKTNVMFDLTVGENSTVAASQRVTIVASAPGFGTVSNSLDVWENDADHVRFSSVGWVQVTNGPIGVLLTAEDAGGNRLSNFHGQVTLSAVGLEGALPLDTTNSGSFAGGQRFVGDGSVARQSGPHLRVSAPGRERCVQRGAATFHGCYAKGGGHCLG